MNEQQENKSFKFFELLTELVGWVQIMISPTLIGGIIGLVIYFKYENMTGKIAGISIGLLGLLIGVVWATKVFKSKKGTISFMSRVHATPDLDKKLTDEDDK